MAELPLSLRPISRENWLTCVRLRVAPEQERFVSDNAFSLAQAAYEDGHHPHGIYLGDEMVGFVLYHVGPHEPEMVRLGATEPVRGWIYRLMVVPRHQGHGIGRRVMVEVIRRLRQEHGLLHIYIDRLADNDVSDRLYTSLGFRATGQIIHGQDVVMKLEC